MEKGKIFNISQYLHIFRLIYFLQNLIPSCTIHCVNLLILLYFALNLETFFKQCDFLEKFILSFYFEHDRL